MKNRKGNNSLDIVIKVLIGLIFVVVLMLIIDNVLLQNKVEFKLNGEDYITINVGEYFSDPGFTIYKGDEDLSSRVVVNDNIDINTIGVYERTYTYEDKVLKRTIEVKKIKEFVLNGESDVYILLNGTYEDPKVNAYLNEIDYSSSIQVYSSCDMHKTGTCSITYMSKELNRTLERKLHISDFKEYFKLDVSQGEITESIIINITMDKTKVK